MKQTKKQDTGTVTVGCLFAAIGGFCKAFQQSDAKILWANEKDRFAAETFRLNFPEVRYIEKPVEDLSVHGDRLVERSVNKILLTWLPLRSVYTSIGIRPVPG